MSLDKDNKEKLFSVVENTSENIENENLQKLKKVFPQFVKDGEIDFDAMQAFFKKEGVLAGEEKYGLNWSGKSNAFKAIRTPSTGTLIPEKDKSKNWDETENIFIEGDNLEVLKLLQKGYKDKIKMIYIDPPYNTSSDFVYNDSFTQGLNDYYEKTSQTKSGIKMTKNTEKNGRYHSDWLTMIYPRLFFSKSLLKNDGIIFVSIGEDEIATLKMLMDELFGEENFVANISRLTKRGGNKGDFNKPKKDYVLVYFKDKTSIELDSFGKKENIDDIKWDIEIFEGSERHYIQGDIPYREKLEVRKNQRYYIEAPDGSLIIPPGEVFPSDKKDGSLVYPKSDKDKCWTWSIDRYFEEKNKNRFIFKQSKNSPFLDENGNKSNWTVYKKVFMEDKINSRKVLIDFLDIFPNSIGTASLEYLDLSGLFENPKPIELIKYFMEIATNEDDIILDFFAGSGTTAHAVMDLNQDGGNRKYICVQLPEVVDENSEAYKSGYDNISEISRERIRRAGDKIGKGDIGFKSYKLSNSNYRKWNDIKDGTDELLNQSKLFIESPLVDNFVPENVVYEIALKEGFDLNVKLKQESGDLKAYVLQDVDRRLFVTFSDKVTKEMVEKLKPSSDDLLVCFDGVLSDTEKVNIGRIINLKVI